MVFLIIASPRRSAVLALRPVIIRSCRYLRTRTRGLAFGRAGFLASIPARLISGRLRGLVQRLSPPPVLLCFLRLPVKSMLPLVSLPRRSCLFRYVRPIVFIDTARACAGWVFSPPAQGYYITKEYRNQPFLTYDKSIHLQRYAPTS
jgi:hypothetical protein